jgi:hypothetical protein
VTLSEARESIGRLVAYTPYQGVRELGVITAVRGAHVFVRYGTDLGSKATYPENLEVLPPG